MKNTFLIILIAVALVGCGSKKQVAFLPTSEVTYQDYTADILTLRVLGYGNNDVTAIENAQIRAFETLFFRGIPNSNIKDPLIGFNEMVLKKQHGRYLNKFFNYKRFLTFISETQYIGGQKQKVIATKINKKNIAKQGMVDALVIAVDILINVKALRKDLEQQQVIKQFGY